MHLQQKVTDIFPADLVVPKDHAEKALPTVKWERNCRLPSGLHDKELEAKYYQWQPNMHAVFVCDNHHANCSVHSLRMKFFGNENWYMRAGTTLRNLGVLCGKPYNGA